MCGLDFELRCFAFILHVVQRDHEITGIPEVLCPVEPCSAVDRSMDDVETIIHPLVVRFLNVSQMGEFGGNCGAIVSQHASGEDGFQKLLTIGDTNGGQIGVRHNRTNLSEDFDCPVKHITDTTS